LPQARREEEERAAQEARLRRERAALAHWRRLVKKIWMTERLAATHAPPAAAAPATAGAPRTSAAAAAVAAAAAPVGAQHEHEWMEYADVLSDAVQWRCHCGAVLTEPPPQPWADSIDDDHFDRPRPKRRRPL